MTQRDSVGVQAIIQARMGSTRLPGKVLKLLAGTPVLGHVVRRAQAASQVQRVLVATTDLPEDAPIVAYCEEMGLPVVRGSSTDVLGRFALGLKEWPCRLVMRLTADCPLLDPGVLDSLVRFHEDGGYDYSANVNPPTFPHGLDAEVTGSSLLLAVHQEATLKSHREHVTLFLREHPERFRIGNLRFARDASAWRLTLDRPEDLEFLQALFERFPDPLAPLSVEKVLEILEQARDLPLVNQGIPRYEWKEVIEREEKRQVTVKK